MPTPKNGQTYSNNLSATADQLLECAWPFCRGGALRVLSKKNFEFFAVPGLERKVVIQLTINYRSGKQRHLYQT